MCQLIGFGGFRKLSTDRIPKPSKRGDSKPNSKKAAKQGGKPTAATVHEPRHSRRCHCTECTSTALKGQLDKETPDWSKVDRVIIEYCCYSDSLMGKKTPQSKGCRVIRVTDSHD